MEIARLNDGALAQHAEHNDRVLALEQFILQAPQVDLNTQHAMSGGVYARTILIPAGTVLTGALLNKDHVNIAHGDITVSTDGGMQRITGYHVLPTKAGMRRVGLAHADTYWTTVCATENTDLAAIEEEMTPDSERLQSRQLALTNTTTPVLED